MATRELVSPLGPVVFSAYSRIHQDVPRLSRAVIKTVGAASMLGFAASLGLFALAHEFVLAVYGAQWEGATILLQILAFSALGACVRTVTTPLLVAQGRQRTGVMISWGQVALSAILMPLAYGYADMAGVAVSRSVLDIGIAILSIGIALSPHKALLPALLKVFGRFILAAIVMVVAIRFSQSALPLPPVLSLLLNVPLGAAVYGATVLLVWRLAGRPDGAESEALEHLGDYLRAVRRRFGGA
jgi:O-antigen/teichoic acid export membrane protein